MGEDKLKLFREGVDAKEYSYGKRNIVLENRFTPNNVVGVGAYGLVCSALDHVTGSTVAIKCVDGVFDDLIDARRSWREMFLLRVLRESGCRHIIQLLYIQKPLAPIRQFNDICLVTDFYKSSLSYAIKSKKLKRNTIREVMKCVLCALFDMHSLRIIHRDIKPANILLEETPNGLSTALCDFGLARGPLHYCDLPMKMTDYVVTRWYRAPELLLGCAYNEKVDVWSLGCVIAECFSGKPLFPGNNYIHQLELLTQTIPISDTSFLSDAAAQYVKQLLSWKQKTLPLRTLLPKAPDDAQDMIVEMLRFDPMSRCSVLDASRFSFFPNFSVEPLPLENIHLSREHLNFDLHPDITEAQVRRLIWDEIQRYHQ